MQHVQHGQLKFEHVHGLHEHAQLQPKHLEVDVAEALAILSHLQVTEDLVAMDPL